MLCDEPHIQYHTINEVNLVLKTFQNHLSWWWSIDSFYVFALKVNFMTSNCCTINVYSCLLKKVFLWGNVLSHSCPMSILKFYFFKPPWVQYKWLHSQAYVLYWRSYFLKSLLICMSFLPPFYLNCTLFYVSTDVYHLPHTDF